VVCQTVYKPSSVLDGHLSRLAVTNKFQRYFCWSWKNTHVTKLNLASGGVYRADDVATISVGSYPTFPSLLDRLIRICREVYFCCTILEVAFTSR